MTDNNRVFISGIGMISPLGLNAQSTWEQLIQGHSGVDQITAFDTEGFDTRFAAQVKGFEPESYLDRKLVRRMIGSPNSQQ